MKKKIIGILVFMLLIATSIVSATTVKEENIETTSYQVDVPVWEVGDTWIYNEHYSSFWYQEDGTLILKWFHNCTSTYTVIDDTGDTYKVKLTSENNEGSLKVGRFRLKFTPFTKLTQELEHRKTDLAYVHVSHQEKGLVFWLIGKIGIPIPAYYRDIEEESYTPANELIPFPLTAGTNGTFSSFTSTGSIKMSLYLGLIKLINGEWLDFENPARDYTCEMANITVPAGTYDAYNISTDMGSAKNFSYSYYVPEVGYIAKYSTHLELGDSGKPVMDWEHELVSTTYTP